MFKKLSRDMEDIKRPKMELLSIITTISEMKNTLDRIHGRLDIVKEKMG